MLVKYKALIFISCLICLLHPERSKAGEEVTFCAVGDVLLDRGVRTLIENNGVNYPFGEIAEFVNSYDLAFCNLECPISNRGDPLGKMFVFRGDTSFIEGLRISGFNVFCLANNHTLDYGRDALLDTKDILEKNGFHTVGCGRNQREASRAMIIRKKGMSFAFLSYVTMPLEGIVYSENLPGPAQADIEEIIQEIERVRKTADFIIVSFHWGTEFSPYPSGKQREYAHRSIDSGADLVLGHHPHVIQIIEKYEGKFIIYSLGNFVFDQNRLDGRESIIFGCKFYHKKIDSTCVVPILIERCQPDFAEDDDFRQIVNKIKLLSDGYDVSFREDGKRLYME